MVWLIQVYEIKSVKSTRNKIQVKAEKLKAILAGKVGNIYF
jgi:hypothetical protein